MTAGIVFAPRLWRRGGGGVCVCLCVSSHAFLDVSLDTFLSLHEMNCLESSAGVTLRLASILITPMLFSCFHFQIKTHCWTLSSHIPPRPNLLRKPRGIEACPRILCPAALLQYWRLSNLCVTRFSAVDATAPKQIKHNASTHTQKANACAHPDAPLQTPKHNQTPSTNTHIHTHLISLFATIGSSNSQHCMSRRQPSHSKEAEACLYSSEGSTMSVVHVSAIRRLSASSANKRRRRNP